MPPNQNGDSVTIGSEVRLATFLLVVVTVLLLVSKYFGNVLPKVVPDLETRLISSREIYRGDVTKKQVIFTFDGGSVDVSALKILSVLKKHGVKGTFFLTGRFIEDNKDIVRRIHDEGHEIFNHTYDHPHLPTISDNDIVSQLARMDQRLEEVAGISSKPYFRAPYGDRDQRVLRTAFNQGYQSVFWTLDALDWMESEGVNSEQVRNLILSSLASGNIYLMHLGDSITGNILDDLFGEIERRGYKIVSLTQGL